MTHPTITIIAALDRDGGIGRRGDLLFHISADLRRFKSLTLGHPIIMGRKTFESFPKGPLPGRRNIVITRNLNYSHDGIEISDSLEKAIALCNDTDNIFIIGGGEIYRQAIRKADCLQLTVIDAVVSDADTCFPPISQLEWHVAETSEPQTDTDTGLTYQFIKYLRNS